MAAATLLPGAARADTNVVARIPLGSGTYGLDVNPVTHRAYVANWNQNKVTVVDTLTNEVVGALTGLIWPNTVAVDVSRNLIHATSFYGIGTYDGTTNELLRVAPVGSNPLGIDVDEDTGWVYVANHADGTLSVVRNDGSVTTAAVGDAPFGVVVDGEIDRVFVTHAGFGPVHVAETLAVIDTETLEVLTRLDVYDAAGIDLDRATHRVFVTNFGPGWMSVIDGRTAQITDRIWLRDTADEGCCPQDLAFNPATGRVHTVANAFLTSVDTASDLVDPVGTDFMHGGQIAVDPSLGLVYVADQALNELIVLRDATHAAPIQVDARSSGPASTYAGKRWTSDSWTIDLSCRTECDFIEFALDGEPMQPYSGSLSLNQEGEHELTYRAVGASDEGARSVVFVVDRTLPEGTASAEATEPSNNGWTTGSWIVHFSCHDPQHPEQMTCLPVSRMQGGTEIWHSLPTIYQEGLQRLTYRLEDPAGNATAPAELLLGIDRTLPASTPHAEPIGPSDGQWARDGWRITLTCADPQAGSPPGASGCGRTDYQLDDGLVQTYEGPIEIRSEGQHTLRYRSVDVAGNVESFGEITFSVDQTPPETTTEAIASEPSSDTWTRGDWTLAMACSDPQRGQRPTASGCGGTRFGLGPGALQTYQAPLELTSEGTHVVRVQSTDRVSNEEPMQTVTLGIDRSAPQASIVTPNGMLFLEPGPVVLQALATDPVLQDGSAGSGVAGVCFDVVRVENDGTTTPIDCFDASKAGDLAWQAAIDLTSGTYEMAVRARDRAGNISLSQRIVFVVQDLLP